LWVFVWGIEDLDLYRYYVFVFVFVVVVSVILGTGDKTQEREKKCFLIPERMNSSSLSWASYCSSA
jgi:hypothetical protein